MSSFFAAAIFASCLTAVGQVLLKLGAARGQGGAVHHLYTNPYALSGYALLLVVTLINLYAFRVVPLKFQVLLVAFTLLLVTALSVGLLGERLNRREWLGAGVILCGIVVYGL